MRDRGKTLARLHRVRTLQLGLVQAAEADANARFQSEAALRVRIAQLAAGVAPQSVAADGVSFAAAALYRERLHTSAQAAEARVANATARVEQAAAATREARRDQHAIEKLIARDTAAEALAALRALEAAPPARTVRHDPC
ncbi:MAG: hypothetical protein V4659_06240 [Pseudomonadota bacterium]